MHPKILLDLVYIYRPKLLYNLMNILFALPKLYNLLHIDRSMITKVLLNDPIYNLICVVGI